MADGSVGGIQGDRLKSFIERIERLEEEKAALASDIKDVFAEAKGSGGFDTKIMRQILKLRKLDSAASKSRRPCSISTSARLGWSDMPIVSALFSLRRACQQVAPRRGRTP